MAIKLWRFLLVVIVISVLMTVLVKHVVIDDTAWQRTSAMGLKNKLTTGINQIYWQWQEEGRPKKIAYYPEHAANSVEIPISTSGRAIFDATEDGCNRFLYWFIDKNLLEHHVNTSIKKIENRSTKQLSVICEFSLYKFIFLYAAETGELQTIRVE